MTSLPQKPLLRVDEVAVYFRVTPRTVYLWIEQAKLPATPTPGGGIRIPRDSIISLTVTPRTT